MSDLDPVFSLDFGEADYQTNEEISPKIMRMRAKHKMKTALRRELAKEVLTELPDPGESIHIVSNGKFDYWSFVPIISNLLKRPIEQAFFSTWTLNRACCKELFDLLDQGKVLKCGFLTGIYFKSRESAIYATMVNGLESRGQKFKALENHSKVTLLESGKNFIVMEGSANFTANPRIEQNTITNSKELFDFHKSWFEEILNK